MSWIIRLPAIAVLAVPLVACAQSSDPASPSLTSAGIEAATSPQPQAIGASGHEAPVVWPCEPRTPRPATPETAFLDPPPAFLGTDDEPYVAGLLGTFSWNEDGEGVDADAAIESYIAGNGLGEQTLSAPVGVVVLTVGEPFEMRGWRLSASRDGAATPSTEGDPPIVGESSGGDPTPAICFDAPAGEYLVHGFIEFDAGEAHYYWRLEVAGA